MSAARARGVHATTLINNAFVPFRPINEGAMNSNDMNEFFTNHVVYLSLAVFPLSLQALVKVFSEGIFDPMFGMPEELVGTIDATPDHLA